MGGVGEVRLDALRFGDQLGTLQGPDASEAYFAGSKRFKAVLLLGACRGVATANTEVSKRNKSIIKDLMPFIFPLILR